MPSEQAITRHRRALMTYFLCILMLGFESVTVVMLILGYLAAWLAFFSVALALSLLAGWRMHQQRLADLRANHGESSA